MRVLGSRTKFSGWSRLATEISSSTASQWSPMPPPISSQSARCAGVASRSRGNHARGADTARPSDRVTVSVSPLQEASTARTSMLSAKVCMPFLQEERSVFDDELANFGELRPAKPPHLRKRHRLQPILRVPSGRGGSRILPSACKRAGRVLHQAVELRERVPRGVTVPLVFGGHRERVADLFALQARDHRQRHVDTGGHPR
jgi:hypothetical protein